MIIFSHTLFYFDRDFLGDVKGIVLVVDDDDLALEGVTCFVAEFAEVGSVSVEPPFKGEGVLGEDGGLVLLCEGYPLAINLHFCARDVEDDAMIVALA